MPAILAWYRQEDWNEWLKLCPTGMLKSWKDWEQGAQDFIQKANHERSIVHISTIRPHLFRDWATSNKRNLDGYSRSEYAAELIQDKVFLKVELPNSIPPKAEVTRRLRRAVQANPEIVITDVFVPYLRRPEASICPLFREDSNGKPEQFGSGVLMRIGDHFFLASAAHVFDSFKKDEILIPGKDHLIPIYGNYSTSKLPDNGTREDDGIDLGYFSFKNGFEDQLDGSLVFLDERDIDPLDATEKNDSYTLIGFPSQLSRLQGGKAGTEITRISGDGVNDHRYEKLGITTKSHILIQYRRKKATNSRTMLQAKGINFGGMSGCGVFAWSKLFPDLRGISQPNLVGILTGYSTFHSVFIVTRIHSILSAMLKEFPNLPISRV